MNYIFIVGIVLGFILLTLLIRFIKVPQNRIAYISGLRRREISGRVGFYIPLLERVDYLDLGMVSIDVRTSKSIPTKDYINISVDAVVNVQIDTTEQETIRLAATNFLNASPDDIITRVTPLLEGNLREIVGMNKLTELVEDRKKFNSDVAENIAPDLKNLGLKILQFNVQNFSDDKNIINDLGIENTVAISKQAKLARTEADKEVALKVAEANKQTVIAESEAEREATEKKIANEQYIAEKNNQLEIRKANLKREADKAKAIADATYEIEKQVQRKEFEAAEGESNLIKQQKEIETNKARQEAELKVKADTELYQRQKEADAKAYEDKKKAEVEKFKKQQEAEALLYEKQQEAQAIETLAKANLLQQQNEAEGIKAKALAEAEGIKAKLEAEANGLREKGLAEAEALDKKAEAMKKMDQVAISEMYFKALPEIAKNVATPLANIDSITMYGDGNSTKMVSDITQSMDKIIKSVGASTGIDVKDFIAQFAEKRLIGDKKEEGKVEGKIEE